MDMTLIAKLRAETGAGVLDAKKALDETSGDLTKAAEILRKKGIAKAVSKQERVTKEGLTHAYIHAGGKVGALVEVLCETDFVSRNEQFKELVHDLAMQVAAAAPLYLAPENVPIEVVAKEKEIYREELAGSGKLPQIIEQIIEGKLGKFYSETCLLKQPFIKDEDVTVEELIKQTIAKVGENIQVRRFVRFAMGE